MACQGKRSSLLESSPACPINLPRLAKGRRSPRCFRFCAFPTAVVRLHWETAPFLPSKSS